MLYGSIYLVYHMMNTCLLPLYGNLIRYEAILANIDRLNGSLCVCRPRVDHYFPDLHHLRFEIEEGTTLDGRPVRFGYNPLEFTDFSWRGYAQMSPIQVGSLHPSPLTQDVSLMD